MGGHAAKDQARGPELSDEATAPAVRRGALILVMTESAVVLVVPGLYAERDEIGEDEGGE
jgi:hypothetical protein